MLFAFVFLFFELVSSQTAAMNAVCAGLGISDCRCNQGLIGCDSNGLVTSIAAYRNRPFFETLTGSLTTEIGLLTELQTLFIAGGEAGECKLVGTLPSEIGLLSETIFLFVSFAYYISTRFSEIG